MGNIIGILVRKNNEVIFSDPCVAEEDTSLENALSYAEDYYARWVESNAGLADSTKESLRLAPEEITALKVNYMRELAEDTIDMYGDDEESLPENFKAIGTEYDEEMGDYVYDPKYQKFENWAPPFLLRRALGKIDGILFLKLSGEMKNEEDFFDTKSDYDNCLMLLGILNAVDKLYEPDEVALTFTLF